MRNSPEEKERRIFITKIPDESLGERPEWQAFKHRTAQQLLRYAFPGLTERYAHLESGRPFVPEMPECRISVSHSLHHVAVAVSFTGPVSGIDIEDNPERAERLAEKFVHEQEYAFIEEGKLSFGILWSAKEAVYKYVSHRGLTEFKNRIILQRVLSAAPLRLLFFAYTSAEEPPLPVEATAIPLDNSLLVWADKPESASLRIVQVPFETISSITV